MTSFLEKMFIVEGILFGIIGLLFFVFPLQTIISLSALIAILFIVVGISTIIRSRQRDGRVFFIFNGIINILFGLVLWLYPISTIDLLIVVYGIWVLVRGAYLMFMSFRNGHFGWNAYTVYNAILVIFGVLVIFQPFSILITAPYFIGAALILTAISEIYIGVKLKDTF
ncbi:MAG: DUF308 domain-containing protein [Turicibacter sp.]|nr:DUF308 domain-containing protein [Turicibacter sp.]